jgi:hypothetical protein
MFTVTINSNLANSAQFRFICNGTENDDIVYIDAVVIKASNSNSIPGTTMEIQQAGDKGANENTQHKGMEIFPNPANEMLYLRSDEQILQWRIYNLSGQLLATYTGKQSEANIASFGNGMYIVHVETEENVYVHKLLKQ